MTNPTTHGQVPEALYVAETIETSWPTSRGIVERASAELRRLHAYCQELESQVVLDCMTHVQNPASPTAVNRYCRAGMCVPSDTKHEPWCTAHRDREIEIESLRARSVAPAGEYPALPDDTQAAPQTSPAAQGDALSDLRARCVEVLAWRETGTLPGEALRTLAREKYGDRYDAIQRAERDTETEAMNLVAAQAIAATYPAGTA